MLYVTVCDAGDYWLLDAQHKAICKWSGFYVPRDLPMIGDGDYLVFRIDASGFIQDWSYPYFDPAKWLP